MREEEIKSLAKAIAAELPFFALIDVTSLKPGDILVVRSERLLWPEHINQIEAKLGALLPEGVKVTVLDEGLGINVLSPTESK